MKLTAKQEKFCQGVADGLSLADAYRAAYNADKFKPESLWVNASKLMADAKVALRVDELRAALAEKAMWRREDSVRVLLENLDDPDAKVADRNATVKILNDMHGYNAPQKIEHLGAIAATLDVSVLGADVLAAIMTAKDAADRG